MTALRSKSAITVTMRVAGYRLDILDRTCTGQQRWKDKAHIMRRHITKAVEEGMIDTRRGILDITTNIAKEMKKGSRNKRKQ